MTATLTTERTAYGPGEEIRGTAAWSADKPPRQAEVRLFWHTEGKGTRDSAVAETVVLENPQAVDTRTFVCRAPDFPPSFSGRLISLIWGVELVLDSGDAPFVELVIAPGGAELVLTPEDPPDGPSSGEGLLSRFS